MRTDFESSTGLHYDMAPNEVCFVFRFELYSSGMRLGVRRAFKNQHARLPESSLLMCSDQSRMKILSERVEVER